mmetsp:Transcript_10859/g.32196  ORF Transcript_10859/g.32196 Transcript_10859/m.32196 type:complete len:212 (+) Transcript_10859:1159-1794(+)
MERQRRLRRRGRPASGVLPDAVGLRVGRLGGKGKCLGTTARRARLVGGRRGGGDARGSGPRGGSRPKPQGRRWPATGKEGPAPADAGPGQPASGATAAAASAAATSGTGSQAHATSESPAGRGRGHAVCAGRPGGDARGVSEGWHWLAARRPADRSVGRGSVRPRQGPFRQHGEVQHPWRRQCVVRREGARRRGSRGRRERTAERGAWRRV